METTFNFNVDFPEDDTETSTGGCFGYTHSEAVQSVKPRVNNRLTSIWKHSETWVINANNGDGTYDLGRVQNEPTTLSSVTCISPQATAMVPGQTVTVLYTRDGVAYIKGPSMLGWQPLSNTYPSIHISIISGMWIQAGAYFWAGYASNFPELPLSMSTTTTPEIEDFPQDLTPGGGIEGDPGPWTVAYGGSGGGVYIQLSDPPFGVPITLTYFKIDLGSGLIDYPLTVPTYNSSNRSFLLDTYSALGVSGYANILEVKVSYTYSNSLSTQLSSPIVGSDHAMNPRAIIMFPSTSNTDEMLAYIRPTLVPAGTDPVLTIMTETITTGSSGTQFILSASQTPVGPVTADFSAVFSFFDSFYSGAGGYNFSETCYNLGASIYLLYQLNNVGSNSLELTYNYAGGSPVTLDDTFTADSSGNLMAQSFLSDGVTTTFTCDVVTVDSIDFGPTGGVTYDLTLGEAIAGNYMTNTGTDANVTISAPVTAGHYLQVYFSATTKVNEFPVSQPITSFVAGFPTVNGTFDPLASFVVDIVTVPSATSGDTVEVQFTAETPSSQTDTFTPSGQTVFTLSQIPLVGTILVDTTPTSGQMATAGLSTEFLVSGQNVLIAIQYPYSIGIPLGYNYLASGDDLYNGTAMVITETDLNTSASVNLTIPFPTPIDFTPLKQFTRDITIPLSSRWTQGWQEQRYGIGFYDPVNSSYTVVSPAGVSWRNRTLDPAVENTNYTLTPWITEVASVDKYFTGYSSVNDTVAALAPGLLRRTNPSMNCSVVSNYLFQGGWGAVGPNALVALGNPYYIDWKAFSDADYSVYFWVRDLTTNKWGMVNAVSVRSLVQNNSGANPLYIPGSGIIHQEAQPVSGSPASYATGRTNIGQMAIRNTWNSWTSDASAVIIGCGWCEGEWGRNVLGLNTQDDYEDMPVGVTDAGYTLSCFDPGGNYVSSLTFKGDSTYSEMAFSAVDASVNYQCAHSADFLTSHGIDTWYSLQSQGPSGGSTNSGYCSIPGFGGVYYTVFTMLETDGDAKSPLLQQAGIPALANQLPRYSHKYNGAAANGPGYSLYGNIYQEDNQTTNEIAGDGDDNFYFCLSIPYFVRCMDLAILQPYTSVAGVNTQSISYTGGTPSFGVTIPGYAGSGFANAMPSVGDGSGGYNAAMINSIPDNYPSTPYVTWNGTRITLTPEIYSNPSYYVNIDSETTPNLATWDGTNYAATGTLVTPTVTVIPNPLATLTVRGTFGTGPEQFAGTAFDGIPYAQNYVTVLAPPLASFSIQTGAAVFDLPADNRMAFDTNARTVLYKVNATSGQLSLISQLDVSHKTPAYPDDAHSSAAAISNWRPVWFTRPCGRYILLLRTLSVIQTDGTYVDVLALETYTNPSTSVPPALSFTTYLPTITIPVPTTPTPYVGVPYYLEMHEGVNPSGQEWATVIGVYQPTGTPAPIRWKIQYPTDATVAPTITTSADAYVVNMSPSENNTVGMASANNVYVWANDDGSIWTRDGA